MSSGGTKLPLVENHLIRSTLHTIHKINLQRDQRPKHKKKKKNATKHIVEENRGELFFDLKSRNSFLTPTQNIETIKEKADKFEHYLFLPAQIP